jgi:hypothetical protein
LSVYLLINFLVQEPRPPERPHQVTLFSNYFYFLILTTIKIVDSVHLQKKAKAEQTMSAQAEGKQEKRGVGRPKKTLTGAAAASSKKD